MKVLIDNLYVDAGDQNNFQFSVQAKTVKLCLRGGMVVFVSISLLVQTISCHGFSLTYKKDS